MQGGPESSSGLALHGMWVLACGCYMWVLEAAAAAHLGGADRQQDMVTTSGVAFAGVVCQHTLWAVPRLQDARSRSRYPGHGQGMQACWQTSKQLAPGCRSSLCRHMAGVRTLQYSRAEPRLCRTEAPWTRASWTPCQQGMAGEGHSALLPLPHETPWAPLAAPDHISGSGHPSHLQVQAHAQPDLLQQPAALPALVGAHQQGGDAVSGPHRPLQRSGCICAGVRGLDARLGKGALHGVPRGGGAGMKAAAAAGKRGDAKDPHTQQTEEGSLVALAGAAGQQQGARQGRESCHRCRRRGTARAAGARAGDSHRGHTPPSGRGQRPQTRRGRGWPRRRCRACCTHTPKSARLQGEGMLTGPVSGGDPSAAARERAAQRIGVQAANAVLCLVRSCTAHALPAHLSL